jgi:hypothetical protein
MEFDFDRYIEDFNKNDDESMVPKYYTPDLVVEGPDRALHGRQEWLDGLKFVHNGVEERLQPVLVVREGDKLMAECRVHSVRRPSGLSLWAVDRGPANDNEILRVIPASGTPDCPPYPWLLVAWYAFGMTGPYLVRGETRGVLRDIGGAAAARNKYALPRARQSGSGRMTKPIDRDAIYRKRAFDADIIELCVRWDITYRLSYQADG